MAKNSLRHLFVRYVVSKATTFPKFCRPTNIKDPPIQDFSSGFLRPLKFWQKTSHRFLLLDVVTNSTLLEHHWLVTFFPPKPHDISNILIAKTNNTHSIFHIQKRLMICLGRTSKTFMVFIKFLVATITCLSRWIKLNLLDNMASWLCCISSVVNSQ